MRTIALDAKEKRAAQRQSSVEVSRIPGLSRSTSLEQNGNSQHKISNDNLSALQAGEIDNMPSTFRTEPVMIQKISYN